MGGCLCPPCLEAEAAVLRIAQRETSPQYAGEFEPITRGFLFAAISLGASGAMAVAYMLLANSDANLFPRRRQRPITCPRPQSSIS